MGRTILPPLRDDDVARQDSIQSDRRAPQRTATEPFESNVKARYRTFTDLPELSCHHQ
jgi:hypothetical protein